MAHRWRRLVDVAHGRRLVSVAHGWSLPRNGWRQLVGVASGRGLSRRRRLSRWAVPTRLGPHWVPCHRRWGVASQRLSWRELLS